MTTEIPTVTPAASILRQGVKSLAELAESPVKKRKWVWDQLIPEAKPVLLGGPPGAGKSYLAQTICMAASEGLELYGYQTNSRPTLYLTCEDDTAELNRRSLTIARGLGRPASAFTRCYTVSLEGCANTSLCSKDGKITELSASLDQVMAEYEFGLVVLDLVPDFWDGNEIVRQEVNHFVKSVIASLAVRHESAIMLLHHPSVQGWNSGSGQSGSTGWEGSVRSRLYLKEADKNEIRQLSLMKSNHSKRKSMNLFWNEGALELTDENFIDRTQKDGGKQRLGKHATNVLEMLKAEGGESIYSEISQRFGSKQTHDGVNALIDRGLVKRDNGLVFLND